MVELAVGGVEIEVDGKHLEHLGASPAGAPDVRACWSVTTPEYWPVLLIELPEGLLVASCSTVPVEVRITPIALRWDEIDSIALDGHAWMLLVSALRGQVVRLLFSSLGELDRVAARLGQVRQTSAPQAGGIRVGERAADRALTSVEDGSAERCPGPIRRPRTGRPMGRARVGHGPVPALDRIERRLASVETLLADLSAAAHSRET